MGDQNWLGFGAGDLNLLGFSLMIVVDFDFVVGPTLLGLNIWIEIE